MQSNVDTSNDDSIEIDLTNESTRLISNQHHEYENDFTKFFKFCSTAKSLSMDLLRIVLALEHFPHDKALDTTSSKVGHVLTYAKPVLLDFAGLIKIVETLHQRNAKLKILIPTLANALTAVGLAICSSAVPEDYSLFVSLAAITNDTLLHYYFMTLQSHQKITYPLSDSRQFASLQRKYRVAIENGNAHYADLYSKQLLIASEKAPIAREFIETESNIRHAVRNSREQNNELLHSILSSFNHTLACAGVFLLLISIETPAVALLFTAAFLGILDKTSFSPLGKLVKCFFPAETFDIDAPIQQPSQPLPKTQSTDTIMLIDATDLPRSISDSQSFKERTHVGHRKYTSQTHCSFHAMQPPKLENSQKDADFEDELLERDVNALFRGVNHTL